MAPAELVAYSLRGAMSCYSRSTEQGEVSEREGITLVNSGVDYPVFNAALLDVDTDLAGLRDRVQSASGFYRARRTGWSCWYTAEQLRVRRNDLVRLLAVHGLEQIAVHRGMLAEVLQPPRRGLPRLDIRPVHDPRTRCHFVELCADVFGLPPGVAHTIYSSPRFWGNAYRAWVGYFLDAPIAIAATDSQPGVIGVYSVGTLAGFRGRGYGELMTRHAIEQAQRHSGCQRTVLQATREGAGLYQRMGYQPFSRIYVHATR